MKFLIKGKNTHTAERPAACDLIRGNKSTALFPRIKSQAAVCVFLPLAGQKPLRDGSLNYLTKKKEVKVPMVERSAGVCLLKLRVRIPPGT
jgi:hypothetical protein